MLISREVRFNHICHYTAVNSNKFCLSNTMGNFESSQKFARSSLFFQGKSCKSVKLLFLQQYPILSYFPEKFLSLLIPDKISRFMEEFCFSPKIGLVRVVTPCAQAFDGMCRNILRQYILSTKGHMEHKRNRRCLQGITKSV